MSSNFNKFYMLDFQQGERQRNDATVALMPVEKQIGS